MDSDSESQLDGFQLGDNSNISTDDGEPEATRAVNTTSTV